jgi:hypothetical protein
MFCVEYYHKKKRKVKKKPKIEKSDLFRQNGLSCLNALLGFEELQDKGSAIGISNNYGG